MSRNSTIINKKKKLGCGHFDFNFSKNRCRSCATIQDTNKRVAEYEEKEDPESISNLIADLDYVFSRYIRTVHSNVNGIVSCFTCSNSGKISEMQCGHFIPRSHVSTRWHEENCKPQCPSCNMFHDGNLSEFSSRLEKETPGVVEKLHQLSRLTSKVSAHELKEMILIYRNKLRVSEIKFKK